MYPSQRHIEIYVNSNYSDTHLAHVVAHEIGHAVDMTLNSTADQQAWRALRGISPNGGWWADAYASDFASPSGDFAECFAVWRIGSAGSNRSQFGSCSGTSSLVAQLAAG